MFYMQCLRCSKITSNPKFCSRTCAASYNNSVNPKRIRTRTVDKIDGKVCSRCSEYKTKDNFYRNKDYLASKCKSCTRKHRNTNPSYKESQRVYKRLAKYGLPRQEYDRKYAEQNGLCALGCGRRINAVDHCHETGRVRGLLCTACNTAIGILGDSVDRLKQVVSYLEK